MACTRPGRTGVGQVRTSTWNIRNDVRYGCYVGGLFGARVGASTPLGSIGGERATGIRQRCPSNWETSGPTKPAWAASFVDQSAYLNSGLSRSWNLTSVYPGQQGWLKFRVRNTGSKTWSRGGPLRLGTASPHNRASPFAVTGEWLSAGRPTAMNEASVAPGQIATFVFKVRVPAGSGAIRESFQVVAEGASWLGPVMWRDFTRPAWAASFVDQSAYLNSGLSRSWNLTSVYPGQQGWLKFRVRNTGSKTWSRGGANPLRLGTASPHNRASPFAVTGEWLSAGRPTAMNEASVAPGQIATFVFKVRVPAGSGAIRAELPGCRRGCVLARTSHVARLHPNCAAADIVDIYVSVFVCRGSLGTRGCCVLGSVGVGVAEEWCSGFGVFRVGAGSTKSACGQQAKDVRSGVIFDEVDDR